MTRFSKSAFIASSCGLKIKYFVNVYPTYVVTSIITNMALQDIFLARLNFNLQWHPRFGSSRYWNLNRSTIWDLNHVDCLSYLSLIYPEPFNLCLKWSTANWTILHQTWLETASMHTVTTHQPGD